MCMAVEDAWVWVIVHRVRGFSGGYAIKGRAIAGGKTTAKKRNQ